MPRQAKTKVGEGAVGSAGQHDHRGRPTAEMLADRERRALAQRTLSMELLGDPVPGRSALDQVMATRTIAATAPCS